MAYTIALVEDDDLLRANYTKALEYYDYAREIYAEREMKSDIATVDAYQGYVYYALNHADICFQVLSGGHKK